jgi:hypothetical protein
MDKWRLRPRNDAQRSVRTYSQVGVLRCAAMSWDEHSVISGKGLTTTTNSHISRVHIV